MQNQNAYGQRIKEVASELQTHPGKGLVQQEARAAGKTRFQRIDQKAASGFPFLSMLWDQINNYLAIIPIVAAIISLALGKVLDSAAIMFIVVFNSVVGVVQESNAEQVLAALKKMSAPNAQVMRDGHAVVVPGREIIAGDIVLLEASSYAPADLRLAEAVNPCSVFL